MGRSARRDVAKPKGNEAFNMSFAISFVFLWPKVSPTTPLLLQLGFHPKAKKFQLVRSRGLGHLGHFQQH
jgi:hypothetical protein